MTSTTDSHTHTHTHMWYHHNVYHIDTFNNIFHNSSFALLVMSFQMDKLTLEVQSHSRQKINKEKMIGFGNELQLVLYQHQALEKPAPS